MERKLPPQYDGWQQHETALRRLSTRGLITEIQDGAPDRRLAALSVIDLADVEQTQIEDWIRILPDPEVNELAGAIPALSTHSTCEDELRWVEVARLGYDRRRLPTFLVMLFTSLEALETRECPGAAGAWERVGAWLGDTYDSLTAASDEIAPDDLSLFVFENYLDRDPIFAAFLAAISRHPDLARRVSANPGLVLAGLPEDRQRHALEQAAATSGIPVSESWAALRGL